MKSVRIKLFAGIVALIIFFVLISWLLNSQYLQQYYINAKKNELIQSSQLINQIYEGDPRTISLELEKTESTLGLRIVIVDPQFTVKYDASIYSSDTGSSSPPNGRLPQYLVQIQSSLPDILQNHTVLLITHDERLHSDFLNMIMKLNNGDFMLLSTPLVPIRESAAIANRFSLYTGIIILILGSILAFLFARKFTRPILVMKEIAQHMAHLDFSRRYPVKSDDEIGELGQSINSLSEQLDKSISELRDANQQLQKDIERERKIEDMRKEFISSVSHELKTPISLIQGYAEGLKNGYVEDPENRDYYCAVIMDEASKMNKLVKDLLDLSQIESGFFKLDAGVFDISLLARDVLNKYNPIFQDKGIRLSAEIEDNITVSGDMGWIEQVLENFINNALNHVDERGIIKVRVENNNKKAKISVFNAGKAIPEESISKIWTSFYKVDKARTRSYGGTGLGLSIVRAILQLHNNNFGVANIDNGVMFWFELNLMG